jgi:hypothetical protein
LGYEAVMDLKARLRVVPDFGEFVALVAQTAASVPVCGEPVCGVPVFDEP